MWCHDCQQDVPAIARSFDAALVCPRCECLLELFGHPADAGLDLATFDPPLPNTAPVGDHIDAELQLIARRLNRPEPAAPIDAASNLATLPFRANAFNPARAVVPPPTVPGHAPLADSYAQQRTATGWWATLLLAASAVLLACGLATLGWATTSNRPQLWQQALALTLFGEAGLIVGLTWMARRLWKNSRQQNVQLHAVDRQLASLHSAQQSASPASMGQFYDSNYYRSVA